MYPRNAASPPRIAIGPVVQISDGAVQSSGVSVVVRAEGGSETVGGGTISYGGSSNVVYYTPTQAETNYTAFVVVAYKTGCIPTEKTVVTTAESTAGKVSLGAAQTTDITGSLSGSVGSVSGHTPQSGDSYPIVNSGTYGNSALHTEIVAGFASADSDLADALSRLPSALTADGMIKADMLYVNGTAQSNGDLNIKLDAIPTNSELATALAGLNDFDPASDTVAHVTLVDTTTTNTDMVSEPPSVADIADGVWDEVLTGHAGASSAGLLVTNASDKANEIAADWADGGRLDLILDARASQASLDALQSDVTDVAADVLSVLDDTGTTIPAQIGALFTTALSESYRTDGATGTPAQILYELLALNGEFAISGTTKQHKKIDGTTNAFASTLDDATNPTAITRA